MGKQVPPLTGTFSSLAEAQEAAAMQHGDRDAFVDRERRLSFAQWQRDADGLARVLVERGVRTGDRVALMLPSSIAYAVACAAAGACRHSGPSCCSSRVSTRLTFHMCA